MIASEPGSPVPSQHRRRNTAVIHGMHSLRDAAPRAAASTPAPWPWLAGSVASTRLSWTSQRLCDTAHRLARTTTGRTEHVQQCTHRVRVWNFALFCAPLEAQDRRLSVWPRQRRAAYAPQLHGSAAGRGMPPCADAERHARRPAVSQHIIAAAHAAAVHARWRQQQTGAGAAVWNGRTRGAPCVRSAGAACRTRVGAMCCPAHAVPLPPACRDTASITTNAVRAMSDRGAAQTRGVLNQRMFVVQSTPCALAVSWQHGGAASPRQHDPQGASRCRCARRTHCAHCAHCGAWLWARARGRTRWRAG